MILEELEQEREKQIFFNGIQLSYDDIDEIIYLKKRKLAAKYILSWYSERKKQQPQLIEKLKKFISKLNFNSFIYYDTEKEIYDSLNLEFIIAMCGEDN